MSTGHFIWYFKMKKKRIILIILGIILTPEIVFIIFITFYYKIIKPYYVYDINYIENYKEEDKILKKDYYDFFNEFINYKKYDKYKTNFYYNFIRNAPLFFLNSSIVRSSYFGYSYIIEADNDYEYLKIEILNNYSYLKTPTKYGNYIKLHNNIDVNGSIFNELYYSKKTFSSDDARLAYECNIRIPSYWFSYNDIKKELVFSILEESTSEAGYSSIEEIKEVLYNSLHS